MDCTVLFFLVILTTAQTTSPHHDCNSDVYSPASGMADLQHNATLQYCIIDNCTIMTIDIGQQLDIIYSTQSHLVVTPTDGQTSMIISKNESELFCSTPNTTGDFTIIQLIGIIIVTVLALVSGYIAVVHMMFKQLRSTFGKLMMFYNIAVTYQCATVISLSITSHNITVHSTMVCYLFNSMFMQAGVVNEAFATCMLAYLAYVMRHSYKSRQLTKQLNKKLYKYSIIYALGQLLVFDIFVLSYDFGTGTYEHALLPNGHCSFLVQSDYDTVGIYHVFGYVYQTIQSLLIITYFAYYYKLNKMLRMVRSLANTDTQQNQLFLKIGITIGATVGISQIIFAASWYLDNRIPLRIAGFFFIIQQCVIMSFYMCTKKMSQLCKKKFCTTETSP